MDVLARAIEFERDRLRAAATSVAPVEAVGRVVGEVLLTAPVPRIRDHNAVVLGRAPELDGPAVADLLDRELGERGVPHRRLYCAADDATRWAPELQARGHEPTDTVVLRWPREAAPAASAPGTTVVEADVDLAEASTRVLRATDLAVPDPDALLDQLAWLTRAQHGRGARILVAMADDRPVGQVRVYPGEEVAQVEELDVHPDAQGRGVGRLLVASALAVAVGTPLVVTSADPGDWPVGWYQRLGFVPLGRSTGFTRAADAA